MLTAKTREALEKVVAGLVKASNELDECIGRQWDGEPALNLSIPARTGHDSDLVISLAITDAINLLRDPSLSDSQRQFTDEDRRRLRPLLENAIAEVDAAADPNATVRPDDGMAVMDSYDWAKGLLRRLDQAPSGSQGQWQDIDIHDVACRAVNYALELAAPDAYTLPLFNTETQLIVQSIIQQLLEQAATGKRLDPVFYVRVAPPADPTTGR